MHLDDFLRDSTEEQITALIMAAGAELDRRRYCRATATHGVPEAMAKGLTARTTIADAAARFGVTYDDLTGDGRSAELVEARQQIIIALHDKGWSSRRIANAIGRESSTVRHALRNATQQTEAMQ